jgi:hypothetical protein
VAELGRAHAGAVAEEVAEIELAGEIQLGGDILDRKPLVRQQETRVVKAGALDVLVNGALVDAVEQRAQP